LVFANNHWINIDHIFKIFKGYFNYLRDITGFGKAFVDMIKGGAKIRLDLTMKIMTKYHKYEFDTFSYIGRSIIKHGTIDDARILYHLMRVNDFEFFTDSIEFASKPVFQFLLQLALCEQYDESISLDDRSNLVKNIILHKDIKREDLILITKNIQIRTYIEAINPLLVAKKYNSDDFKLIMDWIYGISNTNIYFH
jgi:hypothetical protein